MILQTVSSVQSVVNFLFMFLYKTDAGANLRYFNHFLLNNLF